MTKSLNIPDGQLQNPSANTPQPIYFSQQDAFTCLYDAYVDRIYRYVYFRVVDDKLSENITSQVFLEAWEKLPGYQTGRSPIISWLYSIAYHLVIAHGYRQDISMPIDMEKPLAVRQRNGMDEELQITSEQLHDALRELADKQQQVLILQLLCGFSTAKMIRPHDKQQGAIRALQMHSLKGLTHSTIPIEEIYGQ
jgi:RNA polymerase sigma-70 factor (ECF subfamily)